MEWSGPEGPEMNPEERGLLAEPREMLTGLYGLLLCTSWLKWGERRRSLLQIGGHRAWNGEKTASQGGAELFTIENGPCKINRGFGGL